MDDGTTFRHLRTPAALNNNPLNLRPLPRGQMWQGQTGVARYAASGAFCKFATPEDGIAAAVQNLRSYVKAGVHTIERVIWRWAPPDDPHMANHTEAYIAAVCRHAGVRRDYSIARIATQAREDDDIATLARIIAAMNIVEAGGRTVTEEQILAGIGRRLGYAAPKQAVPPGYVRDEDGNVKRRRVEDSTIVTDSSKGAVAGTLAAAAGAAAPVVTALADADWRTAAVIGAVIVVLATAAVFYALRVRRRRRAMHALGIA